MSDLLPIVVTAAGAQPQLPADLNAQLIAAVAAENPGYTANLPGSLIEDISSTDTGTLVMADAARVETINSLTPAGSNLFLLYQLGGIYGVQQGAASNTSVYLVFSGTIGFPIAQGFTVSDGTYQYTVQDTGGIIGSAGQSLPLFAVATLSGSWPVTENTVNQLVTSVPTTITLAVNNPTAGTPGGAAETEEQYRAAVMQAGLASAQGMQSFLKTLLGNIPGVQTRLISVRQISGGGWEVLVGGGDPYFIAGAINAALFDISTLTGSVMTIAGITAANPGVVTTVLNHGYVTGQSVTINNSDPTNYDGTYTATVIDEKNFSIGNTTGFGAYVGNGFCTPNARNMVVSINDYPDTYMIPFVLPPQQTVAISLLWNTTSTNAISAAAVSQLGVTALVNYINSIPVGAPINLFELQNAFQIAVVSLIPTALLTRMIFAVSINGIGVSPDTGTGIIAGDPESYFFTDATSVTVSQG